MKIIDRIGMETPYDETSPAFLGEEPAPIANKRVISCSNILAKDEEWLTDEDGSSAVTADSQESQRCDSVTPPLLDVYATIPEESVASIANESIPPNETWLSKLINTTWKPICEELLKIRKDDDESTVSMFRSLHEAGISKNVLYAIAHLSVTREWGLEREKSLEAFATFLVLPGSYRAKLGCIRTLMVLVTPFDASWQLEEACLKETLAFVLQREHEWMLPSHSESPLLWDLRARCLRYQDISREVKLEIEDVVNSGEETAKHIASGAKWFKKNLKSSLVPFVDYGLDTAGETIKKCMTPFDEDLMLTPKRKSAVTLAADCTSVVREASTGIRLKAKDMTGDIRNLPVHVFQQAVKKIEDEQLIVKMVPNDNQREVLTVAGKVGIASLGAAVIVSEAIVDTTSQVINKTVSVTADVVSHKYGDCAGQIIKDTSATTGNILRTIGHLAGLNPDPEGVTKMVAKKTSKDQIQSSDEQQQCDDSEKPMDPLFLLDSDRYEANIVVKKLKNSSKEDSPQAAVVFI